MKPLPPSETLHELFCYCEDTGHLIRKKTTSSRSLSGQIAGSLNRDGYLRVKVNRVEYMVHRLVWKMTTGEDIPEGMLIDHIDRDRTNNRIENLRLCSPLTNQYNRNPNEGVSYDTRSNQNLSKRWVATLRGKKLGYYETREEALAARKQVLENDPIYVQLHTDRAY